MSRFHGTRLKRLRVCRVLKKICFKFRYESKHHFQVTFILHYFQVTFVLSYFQVTFVLRYFQVTFILCYFQVTFVLRYFQVTFILRYFQVTFVPCNFQVTFVLCYFQVTFVLCSLNNIDYILKCLTIIAKLNIAQLRLICSHLKVEKRRGSWCSCLLLDGRCRTCKSKKLALAKIYSHFSVCNF